MRAVVGSPLHLLYSASVTAGVDLRHRADTPSISHHPLTTPVYPARLCRRRLTSLRSCRHSSTARLFAQVCLGQRRVRSSRQASSSDSFQPVALRGGEAPAAAAGASLTGGSAGPRMGALGGSAGRLAALKPRTDPKL